MFAMKVLPHITVPVQTRSRNEIVDVTDRVQRLIEEHGVREGLVILYVPHTTAAVTVNENYDPDVKHDVLAKLSAMIPKDETYYQHDEGNSDSHLKTALTGNSAMLIVEQGKLLLGQWQGIYFCEFDGPRNRELIVKLVSFGD
jgi:secondary thiamine-phosphate synthase enzyme